MYAGMEDQLMLMKDNMIKISRQMNIASSQRRGSLESLDAAGVVDFGLIQGLESHQVPLDVDQPPFATNAFPTHHGMYEFTLQCLISDSFRSFIRQKPIL